MEPTVALTIQCLLTGDELMSGDIIDSNSAYISSQLLNEGYSTSRKVTIGDHLPTLIESIRQMSAASDVLIINGGLGPTRDDLTAEALSQASQRPLETHPVAMKHLTDWCEKRGFKLNEPNIKQAVLPQGVKILPNPTGSAVGFYLFFQECHIYCTPGVPHELKTMLDQTILPDIKQHFPLQDKTHTTHLFVFGLGESFIQKLINEQLPDWPEDIELGFRAAMPLVELKLTSHKKSLLEKKIDWEKQLRTLLGSHIISDYPTHLAKEVVTSLKAKSLRLVVAESCTGGLIASQITAVPGASNVFDLGVVSYSNAMKNKILGVNNQTLNQQGAVSEDVVISMLKGALSLSGADLGVAVSGIAGPDGGSEQKPVGTLWIAWGSVENINTQLLYLPGSRQYFQQFTAAAALDLIRRSALDITEPPLWFKLRKPQPLHTDNKH
jgi:nicotinamide-nucleotide amidase